MQDQELYFPEAEEVARSLAVLLDVDSVQPGRRSAAETATESLQVGIRQFGVKAIVQHAQTLAPVHTVALHEHGMLHCGMCYVIDFICSVLQ